MNETEQKPMEESAPAVVRFQLMPDEATRFACNLSALFPWAESELAEQILPAFLAAALAGVKACNGAPLMLHITGGQKAARAALFAAARDMLADCRAVVCVPAGNDSAGVASAVRACPDARLIILEDAAPVKSALRYIVQNAGGVSVLAFSQDTFADNAGLHHDGAIELRLRDYIDDTEESTLAEYRAILAKNLYRQKACLLAAAALREAEAVENGRADLTAAQVEKALLNARAVIDVALADSPVLALGTAAALADYAEQATENDMTGFSPINNARSKLQGWYAYEVNPLDVIAPLSVCNPCARKMDAAAMRTAYAKSMQSARVPHPATRRFID